MEMCESEIRLNLSWSTPMLPPHSHPCEPAKSTKKLQGLRTCTHRRMAVPHLLGDGAFSSPTHLHSHPQPDRQDLLESPRLQSVRGCAHTALLGRKYSNGRTPRCQFASPRSLVLRRVSRVSRGRSELLGTVLTPQHSNPHALSIPGPVVSPIVDSRRRHWAHLALTIHIPTRVSVAAVYWTA